MFNNNSHSSKGFTIVELLIVIVVIAVLASITVVAFNGVQTKALNTARVQEVMAWNKLFQVYKAANGKYPSVTASNYCLGSGFPDGDGDPGGECRDYASNSGATYHENDNGPLMDELRTVGSLPSGPREPVNGSVGPYVNFWETGYTITTVLRGAGDDCPKPLTYTWDDGNGRLLCQLDVDLEGASA